MLMIIACHFSGHGGFDLPTDFITLNKLWLQFILMGGSLGNNLFVLISGYFLVNSSVLNFRRLFKLWGKIFFYSIVIYGLFLLCGVETFSVKTMLKSAMPITKNQWWFATSYFILYLIHPYINVLLHAISKEECTKFIKALVLYWCIIPTFTKSDFGANSTINFICLYCFAAYIRMWREDLAGRKYLSFGVLCIMMNFITVVILDIVNMRIKISADYFLGMMRPLTLLGSVCLLLGFRRLNMPQSKFINIIASATFGVYLIHDNNLVRPFLWQSVFRNAVFQESPYLIPYSIAVILTVYISCTLIELIRAKLFKTLSRGRLS